MKVLGVLSMVILGWLNAVAQDIAIRNVSVIDVVTGKVIPNQSVFITGQKISWMGSDKKAKAGKDAILVDGSGKYLLPGLIDSHIHFFQSGSIYTRPDAVDFNHEVPYAEERRRGFENTEDYFGRYLRLGITTVMDVGGPFSNFTIRDSVANSVLSPNILVTGPLFSIVDRKQLELNDPPIVKIESTGDIDKLFAKMLPHKPDFIKIWYIANRSYPAEKSFPLVKYVGETSARNGLKLAVHATDLRTAQLAVDAGATILVHSVDDEVVPDDFVRKLREKNVTYIPTLIVAGNYGKAFSGRLPHHSQDLAWANAFAYGSLTDIEAMDSSSLPPVIKSLRKRGLTPSPRDSVMKLNLMKLAKGGVNIATGTDAGNIGTFHASSYLQELEAMKAAGLSNAGLLKSSTLNAAVGFGIAHRVGSIETGKYADLLILTRNPLESIDHLNSIELVFKNGRMAKVDTLLNESPEAIVQRQVNAYNARNIDAFLATYSDDVEIYDSKGKLIMKGHDQMRKGYEGFFKSTPNLYCEIEDRIVINNKVIDKENVRAGERAIHGVAIYEVNGGSITKVTFVD
jgi:imidazolonepropionase-like amidohydrolase